jgi:exodeoxyribonuclease V beta subunit
MQRLRSLALPGCLSVEEVPDEPEPSAAGAVRWQPGAAPAPDLAAAVFARELDTGWRRTSYTRLTFAAHEAAPVVGSEPEVDETDDELPTDVTEVTGDDALRAVLSPMNELPSGASFGTLVHAVLEEFDPAAGDIAEVLRSSATELIARMGPVGLQADALAAGLTPALRTPLGPLANGRALAHISRSDRLSELEFELPLRGGDRPNGTSRLADVADLLRTTLPPSDPLAGYPQRLADPAIADAVLKGYLTGSIDAVLRVDGRFVIVDYKTNRLGSSDTPLAAWDYRQDAMAQAMVQAHYPLQALLYSVALHRYLRWRLPDYSPDVHLGGVLYLFLRGMCGPQVVAADGSIPGVFAWQPPASVITGLSDLLAKGRR